ncbi:MAG TPA: polyphosphate kinase 2 family protein [Pseudolabrys sp.]|nr:polyphosphate kinase 2 family protein [Pseudolabrys sp.]
MKLENIARRFRIDKPHKFKLADHDPADCCGLTIDKDEARTMLAEGISRLSALQEKLYASDTWSVLIVLQAMDAAGKDGVIKHVMTGLNPQGVDVHAFKQPSAEELSHDFLWRVTERLPPRGRIGIFNRSYYEEVLIVRVHPHWLEEERLPKKLVDDNIWQHRFHDIRAFEQRLADNGTVILKFFLNISKDEQRRRFLARIDEPAKRWKFSMSDVIERNRWDDYMRAFTDLVRETSRPEARWYVVPSDQKWFARLVVAAALVEALEGLKLKFPRVEGKALDELEKARKALKSEK